MKCTLNATCGNLVILIPSCVCVRDFKRIIINYRLSITKGLELDPNSRMCVSFLKRTKSSQTYTKFIGRKGISFPIFCMFSCSSYNYSINIYIFLDIKHLINDSKNNCKTNWQWDSKSKSRKSSQFWGKIMRLKTLNDII